MKSPRRFAFVVLLLLAATFPALAETVATMPAPTGYIDDYAHVLSPSTIAHMEATARELHDKTRAQVFLVTINTGGGDGGSSGGGGAGGSSGGGGAGGDRK